MSISMQIMIAETLVPEFRSTMMLRMLIVSYMPVTMLPLNDKDVNKESIIKPINKNNM